MDRFDFYNKYEHEGITLHVETRTQGWHENGRFSGPPEQCYEDEGERETRIIEIVLTVGTHEITLPDPEMAGLFERLVGYLQADADAVADSSLERDWHKLVADEKFEDDAARADWRRD